MADQLNWDGALAQMDVNTSVQPVVTRPSFNRSEGTGVLHINMNSHENQGILIGIPIYDCHQPFPNFFFYDLPLEVQSFWKTQQGETGNAWRQLLSKQCYDINEDPEKSKDYDELKDKFTTIYQNIEMLNKTDWKSAMRNSTFFGFYMWVISHTDANGQQIIDKNTNIPHRGAQGEGQLAFVQFRNPTAFTAWQAFEKGYAALGQTRNIFYPRLFGRDGFRQSGLMITYSQDMTKNNKPFSCSFIEKSFADPAGLAGLVNNRAVNPNAYQILPEWIEKAKDIRKEFMNTDAENLFEDAHIWDFRRALKAIENCFDYYQAVNGDTPQGKELYEKYVAEFKFNESAQTSAAQDVQAGQTQQPAAVAPGSIPPPPAGAAPVMPTTAIPPQPAAQGAPVIPTAQPGNPGIPQPGMAPGVVPGVGIPTPPVIPGGQPAAPGVIPGVPVQPAPMPAGTTYIPQPGVAAPTGIPTPQPAVPGIPTPPGV